MLEYLRGASEAAAGGLEKRSVGSRGRCEIRPELPLPPDRGSSLLLTERRRDGSGRFLSARTLVLAVREAIWAAKLAECRPLRPGPASLDEPFRIAQSSALELL